MNSKTALAIAVTLEKAATLWEEAGWEADMDGDGGAAILRMQAAEDCRRTARDVLPADRWEVRRGAALLFFAPTRREAEDHGRALIREEADAPNAEIRWVCLGCEGEDMECPTCEQGPPKYLQAQGVATDLSYSIERFTS